jgi:hypothetical protein
VHAQVRQGAVLRHACAVPTRGESRPGPHRERVAEHHDVAELPRRRRDACVEWPHQRPAGDDARVRTGGSLTL